MAEMWVRVCVCVREPVGRSLVGAAWRYLSMSSKRVMAAELAQGNTCRMFFIRHRQCSV